MNRKILLLLATAAAVGAGYAGNRMADHGPVKESRVHQHLEYTKEAQSETIAIDAAHFESHLPLIMINTVDEEIGEEITNCKIEIINNRNGNKVGDEPEVTTWAKIKWRGNSSMLFDKKQYRISFVEEKGSDKEVDYPVMGMREESDWVLNAPFLDKTLMRNYMMYNLSGEIMDWAPNVRFCEMFLDGTYMGLYLMIETVKVGPNRLDLKVVEKGQSQTSYLLSRERYGDHRTPINNFGTYAGKTVNEVGIEYPTKNKMKKSYKEYIKNDLSDIEKALYSLDYDEWDYGYARYMDVGSFVDYYVINEFCANMDAGALSTYAYKDIRGKLTMGPVWDFNNCFNNYKHQPVTPDNLYMETAPWYVMLMRDEIFVDLIIDRYRELRKTYLSDEYLLDYLDATRAYLGKAIDRNFEVWGYTFQQGMLNPRSRDLHSYEEAIDQLKEAIVERGTFMDEHIEILKQYCAESAVKEFN